MTGWQRLCNALPIECHILGKFSSHFKDSFDSFHTVKQRLLVLLQTKGIMSGPEIPSLKIAQELYNVYEHYTFKELVNLENTS